jgi:hypothetical protein
MDKCGTSFHSDHLKSAITIGPRLSNTTQRIAPLDTFCPSLKRSAHGVKSATIFIGTFYLGYFTLDFLERWQLTSH